jgi:nucleotide-binding universal stress UspA family protein
MQLNLILCPIDFSEFSIRAYRHAQSLAEHYRARLVAMYVIELWRYPHAGFAASAELYDEFCEAVRQNGKEQLQEFINKNTDNQVQPEIVVMQGMAADSILTFAQAHRVDVIVMGTHGRRGYDRLMLGSVTDRVMRRAPCPVLAVSNPPRDSMPEGKARAPGHRLNRILFCTDFSENSERALDYAISATEEYDAELILLHVLEEVPGPAKKEEAIARTTKQLDQLIPPEKRTTLKFRTAVRTGKPYQQIIQVAQDEKIDIVTMGVQGRGALDLAVFGSTTYRVMQLGPCPVLAVHV